MTEIGQVLRLINQAASAGIAKNGRAVGAPAQPPPIDSLGTSRQMLLPVEDAVREVARGVMDYIVSSRLTLTEGYQALRAELVSEVALSLLSVSEMERIEKLSQSLSGKASTSSVPIAPTQMSAPSVAQASAGLATVNADDTLEQMLERINQVVSGRLVPPEVGGEQPGVALERGPEPPIGLEQKFVASWTLGSTVTQDAGDGFTPSVLSRNGFVERLVSLTSPSAAGNGLNNGSLAAPVAQFSEGGQSAAGIVEGPAASVITTVPQQPDAGKPPALSGQSSNSPDLLRVDLKELLGGKPAELRIRYDEALIVSKVAVLLEQMNGLARVCDEQDRGASYSRQKPSSDFSRTLRQVLAAALGIVIDGNKIFSTPASVGVLPGRDGLLALDPTILKSALESHRDETAAVLKSLANSFYDNISLFVDPRILARFNRIIGNGQADKADRSRKEKERRWKKDKDLLEKRFLELGLILEESGKLREWLMGVVESFGRGVLDSVASWKDSDSDSEASWKEASWKDSTSEASWKEASLWDSGSAASRRSLWDSASDSAASWREASCKHKDPEPSDEVVKRALPAVDLPWDQQEFLAAGRPEEPRENPVTLFIACTTRALQEEDAGTSIKILLKRKVLSDKLLAERPDLEPKAAMICLANEELLLGKLEAERAKLFKSLDDLSRTMVAARGYRSQFPFPPPMAAFITSEG